MPRPRFMVTGRLELQRMVFWRVDDLRSVAPDDVQPPPFALFSDDRWARAFQMLGEAMGTDGAPSSAVVMAMVDAGVRARRELASSTSTIGGEHGR